MQSSDPQHTKQVIVVRRDLNMPIGKFGAQLGHAVLAFIGRRISDRLDQYEGYHYHDNSFGIWLKAQEQNWFDAKGYTKIVLGVDSEQELEAIACTAEKAGLEVHRIVDEGRTVFNGPTFTCIGIGPDYARVIDVVTGHLRLY